jgi:hypothetical protein
MANRTIGGVIFWGWNAYRPSNHKTDQCQKTSSGTEKSSPFADQVRATEIFGLRSLLYGIDQGRVVAVGFRVVDPFGDRPSLQIVVLYGAASRRKGMWMGGNIPLGYDLAGRRLVVNAAEAKTVKLIFERYLELGCVLALQAARLGRTASAVRVRNTSMVSAEAVVGR